MTYMLDTNVFNRILDGVVEPSFPAGGRIVVTHVQRDELAATRNDTRREALLDVFHEVAPDRVPTASAVWGVSRWDEASWSNAEAYAKVPGCSRRRGKAGEQRQGRV